MLRHGHARYELGELLGRGGMGDIYRAQDRLLAREVAYKRLRVTHEAQRATMTSLFRSEYETALSLHHPSTVHALDYGLDADGPFYTMELLTGSDVSQSAPLPWRQACAVLRDVASVLALLHARRLVHRDVSPNNVRVLADGSTKLLDFGALVPFGPARDIVGTPAFMSPECARGQALDGRADLFSLGAVAYWTLTRRACFPTNSMEQLEEVWSRALQPPSSLVKDIPAELDDLIMQLLQRDRDARPDVAAHVIERLTAMAQLPLERDTNSVAYSYLAMPPLAEREGALRELRAALARLRDAKSGVLLLEAAAGLGRSALLAQTATEAQLDGTLVLRGTGAAGTAPFGLLRELLLTAQSAPTEVAQVVLDATSVAEVIESRARTSARLGRELLALCAQGPLMIAVDDAHLADVDSLAALAVVGDRLALHPLLLVLSVESGATPDDDVWARLKRGAEEVVLQPLTEAGIAQVAASVLGDVPNARRAARGLFEASGGAPGVALNLLRALLHRGDILYAGGTFTLPHELDLRGFSRQTLGLTRLAGLDETARQLANLLGVSTVPLSTGQLQLATNMSEAEVALAIAALLQRGLIKVTHLAAYTLANTLIRAALEEQLDDTQRATLHATIARVILQQVPLDAVQRIAAGSHLIRTGFDALHGADIIAETCQRARYEVAALSSLVPQLEDALAVYRQHGKSDSEALRLLVPLTLAGFYGDLAAQNRHLERTLRVLARSTGLVYVSRLAPLFGRRLALFMGLSWGLLYGALARARERRSFRDSLQAFFGVVASAVAAHVSALDARGALRAVAWLEPFAVAHPSSGPAVARQFALASIDVACGKMKSAEQRYQIIDEAMRHGVRNVDERVLTLIALGIRNGRAQGEVMRGSLRALVLADELQATGPFFAPHAESARVGYYGLRGEHTLAEQHRERAEDLALRGGLSWSANSVLCFWLLQGHAAVGDALGLVHVMAALEPLRHKSPGLAQLHGLAAASLARVRGQHDVALERYTSLLAHEDAKLLPTYGVERAYQAACLRALGRVSQARELCLQTLQELAGQDQHGAGPCALTRQLALATAEMGEYAEAERLLTALLDTEAETQNPRVLGALHHDLAVVALLAGKREPFLQHALEVARYDAATQHPALRARHEGLIARARRAGLLADLPVSMHDEDDDLGDTHSESQADHGDGLRDTHVERGRAQQPAGRKSEAAR